MDKGLKRIEGWHRILIAATVGAEVDEDENIFVQERKKLCAQNNAVDDESA